MRKKSSLGRDEPSNVAAPQQPTNRRRKPGASSARKAPPRHVDRHTQQVYESISAGMLTAGFSESHILRTLIDNMPDRIYVKDVESRFIVCNVACAAVPGRQISDLIGRTDHDFFPKQLADGFRADELRVMQTRQPLIAHDEMVIDCHGRPAWVCTTKMPLIGADGAIAGIVGIGRNVTDRRRAELLETHRRRLLESVAKHAPLKVSLRQVMLFLHAHAPRASIALTLDLPSGPVRLFTRGVPRSLRDHVTHRLAPPAPLLRKLGLRRPTRLAIRQADRVVGALLYFRKPHEPDLLGRKPLTDAASLAAFALSHDALRGEIAFQASHDALTGLLNRASFERRLPQALETSRATSKLAAVFFLDLDGFKAVNDTHGHAGGDELLRQVAARLSAVTRPKDSLARVGGDEFNLVCPGLDSHSDVNAVADRLIKALEDPIRLGSTDVYVRSTVGLTVFPDDGRSPDLLIRNADAALYRAKSLGKNRWHAFTPDLLRAADHEAALLSSLGGALRRQEFFLEYQPQLSSTEGLVGFEALLRWGAGGRVIPPGQFIPLAERSGLIVPIGQWVLQHACRATRKWRDLPGTRTVRTAINVSALQFAQPDFVGTVRAALSHEGLHPRLIELEITESLTLHSPHDVTRKLRELRNLGVTIAIDDFGTGYSSLSSLHRLSIDTIKIPRDFVREINATTDFYAVARDAAAGAATGADPSANAPSSNAVVRAIVSLGQALHLDVLAEGVETRDQCDFLSALGCELMQGYLFSRPVSYHRARQFLRGNDADLLANVQNTPLAA